MEFDALSNQVIGLAIEVHKQLGPGLLESAYENCFAKELTTAGLRFEQEKKIDIEYKGDPVGSAFRADFIIEGKLIVELKSVSTLTDLHIAQLLTYMKLAKIPVGLLINYNVKYLKTGIKRLVL
jgi:GxxExxY protein